jgi:glutaminyl-tRNA synthetase
MSNEEIEKRQHFIRQIIQDDLANGKYEQIITRFPPEPNGYLHIGHAKSICLNFGLRDDYKGKCYLRFDDTNPIKEEQEYVDAIKEDVQWLGYEWDGLFHSSDYYQQLYDYAVELIEKDLAYVDSLTIDEIKEYRGTLQQPGKESPYRSRSIEENLDLFKRMKAGEFEDGTHVLRAKIDMSSGNINMRDPVLYRIRHATHQRTGDEWCIYPMYDFAHPLSDAIEYITHSLCTLEFQDHRPLYDWLVDNTSVPAKPIQTEFARLNVSHTITSKRKLRQLVDEAYVDGWDDPRMPTLKGMRHRGFPAKAIRDFCEEMGVSRANSIIDMGILEERVRDELNNTVNRAMCVLNPIKIVIENYPEGKEESLTLAAHPQDESRGSREILFTRELYIDRDDFMLEPMKKFFRLAPGKEVRLRGAYVIKCNDVIQDDAGNIIELRCEFDPQTLGKKPEGRKVKGVIHWVPVDSAHKVDVWLYDRLFTIENPLVDEDFHEHLNPNSLDKLSSCYCEPSVANAEVGEVFQFERLGYFCVNSVTEKGVSIFHRVMSLKNTWQQN